MVVVDTMPMEVTGYADVLLPECTYLERYDNLRSSPNREPSVALRAPAVKPKFNSKPSWWMAKQIGERLGLGDYFKYNDYAEVLDWQLKTTRNQFRGNEKDWGEEIPKKIWTTLCSRWRKP
jgi:thiosulfate reductase/polysulfide reductase chain A